MAVSGKTYTVGKACSGHEDSFIFHAHGFENARKTALSASAACQFMAFGILKGGLQDFISVCFHGSRSFPLLALHAAINAQTNTRKNLFCQQRASCVLSAVLLVFT